MKLIDTRVDFYTRTARRNDSLAIDQAKAMLGGTGYVISGTAIVLQCGSFWHYSIPVLRVANG